VRVSLSPRCGGFFSPSKTFPASPLRVIRRDANWRAYVLFFSDWPRVASEGTQGTEVFDCVLPNTIPVLHDVTLRYPTVLIAWLTFPSEG